MCFPSFKFSLEEIKILSLDSLGKSTIAALIERFYDVDGGSVKIDGVDIRDLDPAWVRGELIGYINQVI